jgi:sec-independent protein translocase protein TatA
MPHIGGPELLIILGVVLVLFGGRKIPELAKGLGEGLREFKKATRDEPPSAGASSAAEVKEEKALEQKSE